ncbi:MAG: tetratricopeptide repeat protein [Elusimicrobia bacterium]|nr:tetratricopeptide repeat protein [Elusimicrobiota bacterium]
MAPMRLPLKRTPIVPTALLVLSAVAAHSLPEEFTNADTPARELFRTAGTLFESGNYGAATKSYQEFANKHDKDLRAPEAQAMYAESLYRQAIKIAETGASADAALEEARGEFQKALRAVARGDHLATAVGLRLAEVEFNLKRYAESRVAAARVYSDSPGGPVRAEARLLQGRALLALSKPSEAFQELRAALGEHPAFGDDPRFALVYGVALFEVGNSSDSLRYLEKLDEPYAHLYAARAQIKLGRPLVAVERLRKIETGDQANPLVELARYLKAEAFYVSKDYPTALSSFEDFLRLAPRSPYRPAAMFKIGLCQFERQDYLAARGSFQSVLQMAAKSEFAEPSLFMIGEAFLREGRLKEANMAYADMAASFPGALGGTARFKQSWTHQRQSEWAGAEFALKTLLNEQPDHRLAPGAALLLGNVFVSQQRYGDAAKAYQRALDLLPGAPLGEERRTELREVALALLSRANLLAADFSNLVSGYQYLMKHAKPTFNPWRAATLLYVAEGYYRQRLFDQALDIYKEVLATFPAAPESMLAVDGTAWAHFSKGEYAKAFEAWRRLPALSRRPPVAPAKTVLPDGKLADDILVAAEFEAGTSRFNQKKYLEALEAYETFEKAHPGHALAVEAALQAGWCYYRLEYYGQALKTWERVETSFPDSAQASKAAWAIADTYFRAGKHDLAIATYERILQKYPLDPAVNHARLRIAQSRYNAKDMVQAVAAFESLVQAAPDSPEAAQVLDFLTQLLYQPDGKGAALDALERIANARADSPAGASARFRIAAHLYEKGDHAAVVTNLEPLIGRLAGRSELMDAEFFIADSYYQLKRYKDAALAFDRFSSNYPGEKRLAAALFHLGASRFKLEEHAPAAEAFKKVVTEHASTDYAPVALFNMALALRRLGKWDEAAVALREYIKKHPEEAKGSNAALELVALYEEHRQFPLAVELLTGLRDRLAPDDARRLELTLRLADIHAASEDEAKSVAELQTAAAGVPKTDPNRLAALAKLGEYYERKELWAEAQTTYADIARHASDGKWVEAASARAQAAGARITQNAVQVTSGTPTSPERTKKKESRP